MKAEVSSHYHYHNLPFLIGAFLKKFFSKKKILIIRILFFHVNLGSGMLSHRTVSLHRLMSLLVFRRSIDQSFTTSTHIIAGSNH